MDKDSMAAHISFYYYSTMTECGEEKDVMVLTGGCIIAYRRTWGETYRVLTIPVMALDTTEDLATTARLTHCVS